MNRPVRPIHIAMSFIIFCFNFTMSFAMLFKEIAYLMSNQANYEYDLQSRIDELHEDLERLQEE